ncbi:unnamed protein product [Victoria cruziana]
MAQAALQDGRGAFPCIILFGKEWKMAPVIEALAETIISNLLEAVTGLMNEKADATLNAEEDLKILQGTLEHIRMAAQGADRAPFFSSERARDWEAKLKDILYDAEDIIENCRTKVELRRRTKNKVRIKFWIPLCSCFMKHVSTPYQLGNKIKKINKRLEEINRNKGIMDLSKTIAKASGEDPDVGEHGNPQETTQHGGAHICLVTEGHKMKIIDRLLSDDSTHSSVPLDTHSGVSIISIIGQAGSGKTTLAKMVFSEVEEQFGERRWWISVSEETNLKNLFRIILNEVFNGSEKFEGVTYFSYLCTQLKSELSKKRFLLVLDDVRELNWWRGLISDIFMGGATGSKILMICRNEDVLLGIKASYMHKLPEFITFSKSWELFLEKALREDQTEEDLVIHNIRDVGERIVEQCGGLSLVVQKVGSMMHTKGMRRDVWELIANSEIWKWRMHASSSNDHGDIFPGLMLCYNDLSPKLRSCFLYCSIYPKGYCMEKDELVLQWVAHGLVEESEGTDVEETANEYVDDLLNRGFIEESEYEQLKMHDIMHDFARYISGKEYTHSLTTEGTRHLSLVNVEDSHVVVRNSSRAGNNKLRTLLIDELLLFSYHFVKIAEIINFKWLRVLSLKCLEICELPNSIGDLVLLKYLDLSHTNVRKLPSSIGKLCNLQTLNLNYTSLEELPKEMGKLHNLRHLRLKNTKLTFVAEGLGKLTHLKTLDTFLVCDDKNKTRGCNIRELKDLNKLRGELSIKGLGCTELAIDRAEKAAQLLKEKHGLISLELDFDISEDDKPASASEQSSVLEALEPPCRLKEMKICHYKGKIPSWFLEPNYSMLQTLELTNCPLWAEEMGIDSMETLDARASIPALKSLTVTSNELKMPINMPVLEELNVVECASLEQVADMPALKMLRLFRVNTLKKLPDCLPSLEELELSRIPNWEGWPASGSGETTFSCMPCLKEAHFYSCPELQTGGLIYTLSKGHDFHIQLQRLTVFDCPSAKLRWELLKQLPNLVELNLDGAAFELIQPFPSPSEVSTFLPTLRFLTLYGDKDYLWGRVPEWVWGIRQLEELELHHFHEEINLTGHWQCLQKLRCLNLYSFSNVKSLVDINDIPQQNSAAAAATIETGATDAKEQIACLSMLDQLLIWDCPQLNLPEELENNLLQRLHVPFVD